MNKTDRYVDYVFKQVVSEIKLITKKITFMTPNGKTKLIGMQIPGVIYQEDDYHYFSYFSKDLFDRKGDDVFDDDDDEDFFNYLKDTYGFTKELLPQLQKKLERWAKETDPDYNKPLTESENKIGRYINYIVDDLVRNTDIDYDEKIIKFSFFSAPSSLFFLPSSPYSFFSKYLKEMYGARDEEIQIIWDLFRERIQSLNKK